MEEFDEFEQELKRIAADARRDAVRARVARTERIYSRLARVTVGLAICVPLFFVAAVLQRGLTGSGGLMLVQLGGISFGCAGFCVIVLAFLSDPF